MRNGGARTGEILVYDVKYPKRIKNNSMHNNQQGVYANKQPVVDWVLSRLKYKRTVKEFNLPQCLFGLHQLTNCSMDKAIMPLLSLFIISLSGGAMLNFYRFQTVFFYSFYNNSV